MNIVAGLVCENVADAQAVKHHHAQRAQGAYQVLHVWNPQWLPEVFKMSFPSCSKSYVFYWHKCDLQIHAMAYKNIMI